MADLIVAEQSPARVMEVRSKFYELLSHCIPPTTILKVLSSVFLCLFCNSFPQTVAAQVAEKVDDAIKAEVMHWAAFYVRGDIAFSVKFDNVHRRFGCEWEIKKFII